MNHFPYRRGMMAIFCGTLLVLLAACGATTTITTGAGTPSGTPAAGDTPTAATATTAPVAATCAALLPGAGSASAGPSFSDVHFPSGSVSTGLSVVHSGTGLYTISTFQACSSGTSATAVRSFYTTNLAAEGWGTDPTLPFDGANQQACGDPYCWEKGSDPNTRRLIGLESVTDRGNSVVTYQWRVFVAPPAGHCNSADMTGGVTTGEGGPAGFTYPPVTSFNNLGGAAGTYLTRMCSAGDPLTIAAFMKQSVIAAGWQVTSYSSMAVNAQKPYSGGYCLTLNITTGTHGSYTGEWDFPTHSPASLCV